MFMPFHPAWYEVGLFQCRYNEEIHFWLSVLYADGVEGRLMCLEQHIQVAEESIQQVQDLLTYMTNDFIVVFDITLSNPFGQ